MTKNSATEKIISLMFSLGRSIRKQILEENEKERGFSVLQIETLRFIKEKKRVLMKDLAKYLFIAPPSATSLTDDLARAKLIKRSAEKKDRRLTSISLTAKGKKALENCLKKKMEKVGKKINSLSMGEKMIFIKLLEKLSKERNSEKI